MTQLEALKQIARRNGGLISPGEVVEAARPASSPLHNAFCWDDTEAANRYRLLQAQKLIRSFKVEIEEGDKTTEVPVFLGLSVDRESGTEDNPYRLAEDVAKVPDLQAIAENDALEQLRGIRNRYSYLKRLSDIWSAIDSAS